MSTLSVLDAARELPAATALLLGQREISFGELGQRVRERMSALTPCINDAARGAPRTQLVAFSAQESLATLELIYALFELAQPFVPLHARLTSAECAQLLAQLPVQWQVEAHEHGGCRISGLTPRPLGTRELGWFQSTPQLAALPTSGSSGTPQVVALSRRAFLAAAAASAAHLGWHSDDRWLLCLPLAHIGGLSVLTRCLLARRPVVLGEPARAGEALEQRLARAIVDGRPRLLSLVPTQLSALLQLEPRFELPACVRVILTGGAAASESVLRAAEARGWPVLTSYGMTEACSQITTQRLGHAPNAERGSGWPLPGVEVRISEGAIQVRGPTLFSGYLIGPPEPFNAQGWFTTGDLGCLDANGQLQVSGRADQMIISGGENVAPAEVEAALEACPGVLEACVFAVPDGHWGQLVAAGLRLEPGDAGLLLESVRGELERRLATFKRPRQYAFAQAFCYGPTGKLDRRATALALRDQLRPAPRGS